MGSQSVARVGVETDAERWRAVLARSADENVDVEGERVLRVRVHGRIECGAFEQHGLLAEVPYAFEGVLQLRSAALVLGERAEIGEP